MRRRYFNNRIINNKIIIYTSSDNLIVAPHMYNFGANIVIANVINNNIGKITFDRNVTTIGYSAFYNCTNLTSMTLPESVISIGNVAFCDCSSLTSITIPEGVISIGGSAFSGCSSLTSITIPEGVTSIGNNAFEGCTSLTSITIPEGVVSIENETFEHCTNLTDITIPDGVTSIGDWAFCVCSSLTDITIPESVVSIGNEVFRYCKSLTSVYCKATTPPSLGGNNVFDYNASGRTIYVPAASVEAYKNADGWKDDANSIVGYDFEDDGEEPGGTGKIVNHGVITTSKPQVILTFEYPVATDYLEVSCGDAQFVLFKGGTTSNYSIGPGESLGSTVSFYPSNEDDIYIYEVSIE